MKHYTKYYLVKKDYLSNDKRPSFFVQLNYGKAPTVSNYLSLEANEYLSRNKLNDTFQGGKTNGPGVSGSFAPVFTTNSSEAKTERRERPQTTWINHGPDFQEKAWQTQGQEETLNNSTNNLIDMSGSLPPDDNDNDNYPNRMLSPNTVQKYTNTFNLLNETDKRLDAALANERQTSANLQTALEQERKSNTALTPFEQLNNMEKVLTPTKLFNNTMDVDESHQASNNLPKKKLKLSLDIPASNNSHNINPTVTMYDATMPSMTMTSQYRDPSNLQTSLLDESVNNETVKPTVPTQMDTSVAKTTNTSDTDLSNLLANAPLTEKNTPMPLTPVNQKADIQRIQKKLVESSTPKKKGPKNDIFDTLNQSDIPKIQPPQLNTSNIDSVNSSIMNYSTMPVTQPIEEGTTLPMSVHLPPQFQLNEDIDVSMTLVQPNGEITTIPLNMSLPNQQIPANGDPLINFTPSLLPPALHETLHPGEALTGQITIQQNDNELIVPFNASVPRVDQSSFNVTNVPQSTNVFHLTFYPNDVAQSTKLHDTVLNQQVPVTDQRVSIRDQTTRPITQTQQMLIPDQTMEPITQNNTVIPSQSITSNQNKTDPSVQILYDNVVPSNLKKLSALKKLDKDRKGKFNLNKLPTKRSRQNTSNLDDPKERNAKAAAVKPSLARQGGYLSTKNYRPQRSFTTKSPSKKKGGNKSINTSTSTKSTKGKSPTSTKSTKGKSPTKQQEAMSEMDKNFEELISLMEKKTSQ